MFPYGEKSSKPIEEFRLSRHAFCEGLIHVMMGIDETRGYKTIAHVFNDVLGVNERRRYMLVLANPLDNAIINKNGAG